MSAGRVPGLISKIDGFAFGAHHAHPSDARRGGLVVIHGTEGLTEDIRDLSDGFADDGYEVLAPALFDRPGRDVATDWVRLQSDVQAAVDALAGPVNIMGLGWGGTLAWLAACRCDGVAAVSSFHGPGIVDLLDEAPRCPTLLHVGKRDPDFPPSMIARIADIHPDLPIYLYDAGPGFALGAGASEAPDSARLARLRTLQLFQRSSGVRAEH